jgi:hypothetical protein
VRFILPPALNPARFREFVDDRAIDALFLLREIFGYAHAEFAAVIGRSEVNCRQLSKWVRRHVSGSSARTLNKIRLGTRSMAALPFLKPQG